MTEQQTARGRVERVFIDEHVKLLRSLFAFARSREIAEDAMAEAFAQAIRHGDDVRDVRAWVWRTAFRLASRDLAGRRRASAPVEEDVYLMDEPATDLFRALASLPPKQRGALILHHYADHPVRDVALMLGSTSAAVRVHLSAGRKRLRAQLGDLDG